MKSEDDPISEDEWLLRRIYVEKFRTDKLPIISPNAFEPRVKGRDPDTEGISLYRAACLSDASEVLATVPPERWEEYGIVRVSVRFLHSLNLTVESKPDVRIKGHVVIPEINAVDYTDDKARFTPLKEKLASEASKDENILRRPSTRGCT